LLGWEGFLFCSNFNCVFDWYKLIILCLWSTTICQKLWKVRHIISSDDEVKDLLIDNYFLNSLLGYWCNCWPPFFLESFYLKVLLDVALDLDSPSSWLFFFSKLFLIETTSTSNLSQSFFFYLKYFLIPSSILLPCSIRVCKLIISSLKAYSLSSNIWRSFFRSLFL